MNRILLENAPPGPAAGSAVFTRVDQAHAWLEASVVRPIFAPRTCGDGLCERPFEFPAFGRFGCAADCGLADTASVAVVLSADYTGLDFSDAAALLSLCAAPPNSPPPPSKQTAARGSRVAALSGGRERQARLK